VLIEQGGRVDDLPDLQGVPIRARGAGNSDYRKLEAPLIRDIPREMRLQGSAPDDQDRIIGRRLLETVVLDVEGLEEEGAPIRYGREPGSIGTGTPVLHRLDAGGDLRQLAGGGFRVGTGTGRE